jgi:hypothetical protein
VVLLRLRDNREALHELVAIKEENEKEEMAEEEVKDEDEEPAKRRIDKRQRSDIVSALEDEYYDSEDEEAEAHTITGKRSRRIPRNWHGEDSKLAMPQEEESVDVRDLLADSTATVALLASRCAQSVLRCLEKGPLSDETCFTDSLFAVKCLIWMASSCSEEALIHEDIARLVAVAEEVFFLSESNAELFSATGLRLHFLSHVLVFWSWTSPTRPVKGGWTEDAVRSRVQRCLHWLYTHRPIALSSFPLSLLWAVNIAIPRLKSTLVLTSNTDTSQLVIGCGEEMLLETASGLLTASRWIRLNLLVFAKLFVGSQGLKQTAEDVVDILSLCLAAARLPISLDAAREFTRLLASIEVRVRNDRLSEPYLRIVCGLCLGLLQAKFKPVWEPSIAVLSAAVIVNEEVLWSVLNKQLSTAVTLADIDSSSVAPPCRESGAHSPLSTALRRLAAEETDRGIATIGPQISQSSIFFLREIVDETHEDLRADSETALLNVLSLLSKAPSMTQKRSRAVVELFSRSSTLLQRVMF